jgi:hypothetical protein
MEIVSSAVFDERRAVRTSLAMTEPKKYVRPKPMSKDKLREMLAEAVRNTQPELNTVPQPGKLPKQRGRPPRAPR